MEIYSHFLSLSNCIHCITGLKVTHKVTFISTYSEYKVKKLFYKKLLHAGNIVKCP